MAKVIFGNHAAQQKIPENQALQAGLEQKSVEFVEKGSEVYAKA